MVNVKKHLAQPLRKVLGITASELPLVLAFLVGLFLRLYQIALQIPADDEWHALHAVMTGRVPDIATHLGAADYCIPMALAFRIIYLCCGLSEIILRFPSLFFGIVFLLVGPFLARAWLGRTAGTALSWLLAVSPLLVFYSRYARPYMISAVLCFIAAFAFLEWWKGLERYWGLIYLVCAILAPYFHLSTLPFVLAPLVFGFGELVLFGPPQPGGWKKLTHLSMLVFAGLGLLIGPPLINDQTSWSEKVAHQEISLATLSGSAELFTGVSADWLIAGLLLLAFVGTILLIRRDRRLSFYLLVLLTSQIGANFLVGPVGSQVPIVFVRYSLACLPLILLFVAFSVSSFEDRVRQLVPIPIGASAIFLGALLLTMGPLKQIYYYPNNWTNHGLFQYCYSPENRKFHYRFITKPEFVSKFYYDLSAQPPGSLMLLEAPWYYAWHINPYPHFQRLHRQKMMIGFIDDPKRWDRAGEYPPGFSRMRFWSFVHLSQHKEIAGRGVDYVVLHRDLSSEVPNTAARIQVDMTRWIAEYRSVYGNPYFEDASIVVFKTDNRNRSVEVSEVAIGEHSRP